MMQRTIVDAMHAEHEDLSSCTCFNAVFHTLKLKFGVNLYMENGKVSLVSRRGTYFHVQFTSKRRDVRKILRTSFPRKTT